MGRPVAARPNARAANVSTATAATTRAPRAATHATRLAHWGHASSYRVRETRPVPRMDATVFRPAAPRAARATATVRPVTTARSESVVCAATAVAPAAKPAAPARRIVASARPLAVE